jgi:protoporphyrinogen oxidase
LFLELLGADLLEVERSSWIYIAGRWVPYPFQTNTWALSAEIRDECLNGYLQARRVERDEKAGRSEARDFHDFVVRGWGDGIARHFMIPYNEKLWALPLEELVPTWAGRFLPETTLEDVVRGAEGPSAKYRGYNSGLLYPRCGGIGLVAARLGERLNGVVEVGCRVIEVDLRQRRVRLDDGRESTYQRLVSTIPLPALSALCNDRPRGVSAAASGLRAASVTCVNVAVRGPGSRDIPACHWVYFPDKRFGFYRAGCSCSAVPSAVPAGCRSFTVEFSHHGPVDGATLQDQAISGLRECGLIGPADHVLFVFARTIPCAYVVFDREREWRRRAVLDWFASQGVLSVGRYGGWQYGSMEDALLEGRLAARRVLNDAEAPVGLWP